MLQDLMIARNSFSPRKSDPKDQPNSSPIKANPVPITSKIPMYKQIVADQEHRCLQILKKMFSSLIAFLFFVFFSFCSSQLAKLNSAIELQSKMKPFVFSDEVASEKIPKPQCNEKPHMFRAKPCPRNLFSNYFYHKMWEEEYFRTLNRKLRAEELMKISSLPPSMRKREKSASTTKEPCGNKSDRTYSAASSTATKRTKRRRRTKKKSTTPDYCHLHDKVKGKNFGTDEFITTTPNPFQFETEKRSSRQNSKKPSSCTSNSSSKNSSSYQSSPVPLYPAARPNLAANLRVEWARKKLCEMSFGTDKTFPKEKLKRPNWGVRKTSAWKSLYYE